MQSLQPHSWLLGDTHYNQKAQRQRKQVRLMKIYTKLAISLGIIFFLLVISGAVMMAAETSDDIIEIFKKLFHLEFYHYNYDCAKEYDRLLTIIQTPGGLNGLDYTETQNLALEIQFKPFELMENRCYIDSDQWREDSQYEYLLGDHGFDKLEIANKIYLEEMPCNAEFPCNRITEQKNAYWDYKKACMKNNSC